MIDLLIQRLKDDCVALKTVEAGVDLANLMEGNFSVPFHTRPAAFVMFGGDQAGKNEMSTDEVVQVVTEVATVTICLGDGTPGATQAAKDTITTVKNAVRDCLMGFVPEPELGALHYRGTAMLAMKPRTIWFQVAFARQYGARG